MCDFLVFFEDFSFKRFSEFRNILHNFQTLIEFIKIHSFKIVSSFKWFFLYGEKSCMHLFRNVRNHTVHKVRAGE